MRISCGFCKKVYEKASRGVAYRLRKRHFCSKQCFSDFAKPKNYFFKRKHGKHKSILTQESFEREIAEIEFSNTMSRIYE